MRIENDGQVLINTTNSFQPSSPSTSELLAVYADNNREAIHTESVNGIRIYAKSSNGIGAEIFSNSNIGAKVNSTSNITGVFSSVSGIGAMVTTDTHNVAFVRAITGTPISLNYGAINEANNPRGVWALGVNTSSYSGNGISGIVGLQNQTTWNSSTSMGTGVAATGEIGLYSFGLGYGKSIETYSGHFTTDYDNNQTNTDGPIAYIAGNNPSQSIRYSGYFNDNQSNAYSWVGASYLGTAYKILGTGSVSKMVEDNTGNSRILFASESPEILFENFGTATLNNGEAYIKIDPVLSKSIHVDTKHPLKFSFN